jgi:hypothetical protein
MFEEYLQHEHQFINRFRVLQWSTLIGTVVALGWVWVANAVPVGGRDVLARRARQKALASVSREGPILDRENRVWSRPVQVREGRWQREYPFGPVTAQLLLSGSLGAEQRALGSGGSAVGNFLYGWPAWVVTRPPLKSTLHAPFSTDVQRLLLEEGIPGTVICYRPNGELLTLVDAPAVDPERYLRDPDYHKQIDARKDAPLYSRGLSIQPLGSVVKPLVGAILLEGNKIPVGYAINCTGHFSIHGKTFYCAGRRGHGRVTLRKALAVSCNCFFFSASAAGYLTQEDVVDYFHRAGLLNPQIRALSVQPGVLPLPHADDETWAMSLVGLYSQLPLLGLAQSYTCLVDGRLHPLHVLSGEAPPAVPVFRESTAATIRRGLEDAAIYGTARPVRGDGALARWKACGKTGTTGDGQVGASHALFAGFAPGPDNPQIMLVVFLEGGGEGRRAAALAGRVIDLWFRKYAYAMPEPQPAVVPADAPEGAVQESTKEQPPLPDLPRARLSADEKWALVDLVRRPQQVICFKGQRQVARLTCSGSRLGTSDRGWCQAGPRKTRHWYRGNARTKSKPGGLRWWVEIIPDTPEGTARADAGAYNGFHESPGDGYTLLGRPAVAWVHSPQSKDARFFWRWVDASTPLYFQTQGTPHPRRS